MKKFKKWIKGIVTICISGQNKDRLINICKNNNIEFYNLKYNNSQYIVEVPSKDLKKLLIYNDKTNCELNIVDKYGLLYFFYKYKKRKIFAICIILFLVSIYSFSFFIWNIKIQGNTIYTEEELIKDITENHVNIGAFKSKINCNELEKLLREEYDKLAWISCEIKGTNLIIDIKETISSDDVIEYNEPCNIVAYKDAIITDLMVNSGNKVANLGDQVKKNDILITGIVNIYNEYDEILDTNYTYAKGTVKGIVEYEYSDKFNLTLTEKIYTNNNKSQYSINIGKNIINLPFGDNNFKLFDSVTENKTLKLFNNFYLPFGISKTENIEYTLTSVTLNESDAITKAKNRLYLYIDNLKKKGVSILENNVTISIENDICVAKGTIICEEAIGVPKELEIIKEGEEP